MKLFTELTTNKDPNQNTGNNIQKQMMSSN